AGDPERAHATERDGRDEADDLPDAALELVAQERQLEADQVCSHSSPSTSPRSPPTSSTNRSCRLRPARTSSRLPAARTWPPAMTATWSHRFSTSSMTWLDRTTVPPPSTNERRMRRIAMPDTGSTA